jgi:hypothetical protein
VTKKFFNGVVETWNFSTVAPSYVAVVASGHVQVQGRQP